MNRYRHVESGRLFVNGVEIWIDQMFVVLEWAETHRGGAIFFGVAHLLNRFTKCHRGNNARPSEPIIALLPYFGHPAVPRLTKRDFGLGFVRDTGDPHGVE
jgi:hypothetical protein